MMVTAPTVDRHCKRCGKKTAFASSGLFRVNAQQKSLDVWLIYKCATCDTTWNMTILSRVSPQSIPPELLESFHDNDAAVAMIYASDVALIKRNGGEPGSPVVEVDGPDVDLSIPVRIHMVTEHPTEIKLMALLRGKLGLSRSQLDRMCKDGTIRCLPEQDMKKCKLAGEIILEIR